jgi:hypothetical protein
VRHYNGTLGVSRQLGYQPSQRTLPAATVSEAKPSTEREAKVEAPSSRASIVFVAGAALHCMTAVERFAQSAWLSTLMRPSGSD